MDVPSIFDLALCGSEVANISSSPPHYSSSYVQQTFIVYGADACLRLCGHGARDKQKVIRASGSVLVVIVMQLQAWW